MSTGDHSKFAAFARRILRAMARRYAAADVEDLAELLAIRAELDTAIEQAVCGLREQGFSWSEIARGAGTTKQAAQQRWGVKAALTAAVPAREVA